MLSRPFLSVRAYDRAEARGTVSLSIPQLMAFKPKAFEMVGWPTRVDRERELLRYVDHNFESEVAGLFLPGAEFPPAGYRNAFTLDERDLVASVRDKVAALTKARFGRAVRPISNVLVQVGPYRMLAHLAQTFGRRHISIFEVGPGIGYLGAMLAATGHRYLSYDVTQPLYLWQSRILQAVAGSDFTELARFYDVAERATHRSRLGRAVDRRVRYLAGGSALAEGRVVHLPWWTYAKLLGRTDVRVDVVYSNSNLGELSRVALRHVLQISRAMLSESEIGLFCYMSKGSPAQMTHEDVDEDFRIFGYHRVLEKPFSAFALDPEKGERIGAAFKDGLPFYNPSGRQEIVSAHDVVPLHRRESPLDVDLAQWYNGWAPQFVD